jgi:phosphoribosylglycinamide formyltransferase-1
VLERGLKVTGATAYFADSDGRVGGIILQKAVEVRPGDDPETLGRRVMEECEWPLLTRAVAAYCGGELNVRGNRVRFVKPPEN